MKNNLLKLICSKSRHHASVLNIAVFGFLMSLFSTQALAVSCLSVFPDVASSHANNSSLTFANNARLYGTDGIINFDTINNGYASNCDTQACVSSGVSSETLVLPSFQYTNSSQNLNAPGDSNYYMYQGSYDDLTIGRNVTLDVYENGGLTKLSSITTEDNVTLRLSAGAYWIDKLSMGQNSNIEVVDGDQVIIYLNEATFGQNVKLNITGGIEKLVIVSYSDFALSLNSSMNGYLYAQDNLVLGENIDFYGAFAAANVTLGQNGKYYTRLAELNTANFGNTCEQVTTIAEPIAYYPMDMCMLPSGTGSIKDEIGSNDGDTEGSIGLNYAAKYCQSAVLSGDRAYINLPDPASSDLSQGSISLYFNTSDLTHNNYPSAGAMTLVSRDANGTQTGGHLTIWLTDSGAISARQQSASYSYTTTTSSYLVRENQWHHLVYTWGSEGMHIYLDGSLKNSPTAYTGGLSANGVDMAVGANAWGYQPSSSTPRVNQLRDFFKGSIDEIRVFDEQLSQGQVNTLQQIAAQTCTSCSSDPVEIAHWGADVCSFNQEQVIESISGMHAVAHNGISNEYSSRFCQGLAFDGNQSYLTVDHDPRLEISDGAISMWVKLPNLAHSNDIYAGGNALLSKDHINLEDGGHLDIRVDASGKVLIRHQSTTSQKLMQTDQQVIFENQWHHVVYSFGAMGSYLYVDNQLVVNEPTYFNGWSTNQEVLAFGATSRRSVGSDTSASNFNDFLLGEMDQIKIYSNQPSGQDVANWYSEQASQCTTCSSLVAEYTFDQTNIDSNIIEDSSGNNNDGLLNSSLDTALLADNISCRALASDDNLSASSIAFDTQVDANELGSQGAITFWYQSNNNWNDGVVRKLIDASRLGTSSASDAKYFYLSKTSTGELSFGLEDSTDDEILLLTSPYSFTPQEWVHIGVQWNLVTKEFRIFVNGQEAVVETYYEAQLGSLGELDTIVFGDNKINYVVFDSTNNAANGYFDDIRMYSQAVGQAQVQADMAKAESCETVHHYLIEHPADALTCDTPEIIIKACANETCSELSNLPSSLTLTPNTFLPSSTVTFSGQTGLILDSQPPGTFSLSSTIQDPAAPIECSNNCDIEFQEVGIQFFNRATGATNFADVKVEAEATLDVVGIRIVGNNGGTCEGLVNGTRSIDLEYACVSTNAAPYTPDTCNVAFASIPLSGSGSQSGTVSLNFDGNGEANFAAFSFADAGILRLTASTTINGMSITPATIDLKMVPASLLASSSLSAVNIAGVPFDLSLSAIGSQGSVLPGYVANDLKMSALRLAPNDIDGADSEIYFSSASAVTSSLNINFADISANFTNGLAQSTSALSEEVGSYQVSFQDSNYLGASIASNILDLGRFTPAYLDVQKVHQPMLANTHSTFTYIGQSFTYQSGLEPKLQITAYNALGQITRNYSNSFWALNPTLSDVQNLSVVSDSSVYSGPLNRVSAPTSIVVEGTNTFTGQATISILGSAFDYSKVVNPSGDDASPFSGMFTTTFATNLFVDTDGICYQTSYPSTCAAFAIQDITGNTLKYGRLNVDNAFGPETEELAIPLFVEYLDQGQWRRNIQDSETLLELSQSAGDISLIHDQQSAIDLTGMIDSIVVSDTVLSGNLPANALSIGPLLDNAIPQIGSFYIQFNPDPRPDHWSNHLNFDWNGDGSIDDQDEVVGNVNLGIYKGSERTLHWREVLN